MTVPIVAVNCDTQSRQLNSPARVVLPVVRPTLSDPQWGHTGPFGQRMLSSNSRASSSVNRFIDFMD